MTAGTLGIAYAVIAMLSWGFGDYLIQRAARLFGVWKPIFFISLVGIIGLLPLVWGSFGSVSLGAIVLFAVCGAVMMAATFLDYRALREGKLSIVEPIVSMELPIAAMLAVLVWHESISITGWLLVVAIFIGTTLAVTEHHTHLHYHRRIFERGARLALGAACCMALLDLVMGISSQQASPLLTVWVVWVIVGMVSLARLVMDGKAGELVADLTRHPRILLTMGVLDTAGWVGFCLATSYIQISVSAAIAESYVIITILLGLLVNRESLKPHQKAGLLVAVAGVVLLALLMG